MSAENEPWWRDTPAEVGRAFLRWNEAVDELHRAVEFYPQDPVEKARLFDGLDLAEIAAAIDAATEALYLLPGMDFEGHLERQNAP